MEADDEPSEADFLPGLLAHSQWQGGTWGLPAGEDPLFIFYDPTAFDAVGLKHPSPGWTWDELFDAAKQLTQREGERVVRYGFADFGLESVRSAIEAQGGRLVDDSEGPPVPTLDDPRTIAAVQWYADLALTHGVMLNPTEVGLVDSFTLVQAGEAAMSVSLARMWVGGARQEGAALRLAALPGMSPAGFLGYFISAGTAHPEAAWRWLQFLSRQVAPPDRLPARQSLIPDSAYAAAAGEEALEVFRYAAEHALPPVRPAAVEVLLQQAVEQVFEGEEVESTLAEVQQQALVLLTPGVAEPFTVPSPPPVQATAQTITFVVFSRRPFETLAKAFHEAHPEIEVVVREAIDFDYYGGPPAEMIAASGADCFQATMPPWDEVRPAVLNLQPFIDADPTFPLDDYLPRALEAARYGGDLWALPAGMTVGVLWYNRTLFDEASLPYPESGWSWDDLFLTARTLSGGEGNDRCYGFVIWPGSYMVSLLEAVGGPLVDESAVPPNFRFDAPEVVATVRQLAGLVQDGVVPIRRQAEEQSTQQDLFTLIWANRVGMWTRSARAFENEDFDFHPAPPPKPNRCLGLPSSSLYYIAIHTPHAQACWQWLWFLSDYIPGRSLPPRRSLLTSDAFREQVGADAQAVYLEALECEDWIGFRGLGSLPPYSGQAYIWLEQALGEILWQGADAQATLSEAQQKAEAYLDCLRQRPNPEDRETADACFQKVDAP